MNNSYSNNDIYMNLGYYFHMRLFIGIQPDYTIRRKIKAFGEGFGIDGKFTSFSNIHQTLIFLGNCDELDILPIKTVIQHICDEYSPFVLGLKGSDCFRRRNKAVLYLGVDEFCSPLLYMQQFLAIELIKKGFILDERKYLPHITVGRGLDYDDIIELSNKIKVPRGAFLVRGLTLFHSTRIDDILTYIPLHETFFKGSIEGIVDRIEASYALVEIGNRTVNIPQNEIKNNAHEGDILSFSREIEVKGFRENRDDLFEKLWK